MTNARKPSGSIHFMFHCQTYWLRCNLGGSAHWGYLSAITWTDPARLPVQAGLAKPVANTGTSAAAAGQGN